MNYNPSDQQKSRDHTGLSQAYLAIIEQTHQKCRQVLLDKPHWCEIDVWLLLSYIRQWNPNAQALSDYYYPLPALEHIAFDIRTPRVMAQWLELVLVAYRDQAESYATIHRTLDSRVTAKTQMFSLWQT
jgi:hypothetical protein